MNEKIFNGLKEILRLFDPQTLFPRTIMTKKQPFQKEIFDEEEILHQYEASNFVDCRINAFPAYVEYKGLQRYPPDFIFIDLDKNNFKTDKELDQALKKTISNIKVKLGNGFPTVLWTGNGYHVYQPISSLILEQTEIFAVFEHPSKQFLHFAKNFLSDNKADRLNHPSFKSTLLRIPGSLNSKLLQTDLQDIERAVVKVIQLWDGKRPSINFLLRDFRTYLIDLKLKEENKALYQKKGKNLQVYLSKKYTMKYFWIETLLKTPVSDYRKNAVRLILAPYLVNILGNDLDITYKILTDWLKKCESERKLNFSIRFLVNDAIRRSSKIGIPPMRLETLRSRNSSIYKIINERMNHMHLSRRSE